MGKRSRRRWLVLGAGLLFAVALAGFFFVAPPIVEAQRNAVLHPPPYRASARAAALHRRLLVADLHADSLLWGRDLARRGRRGHVDLPRLVEGNVALQMFTIVTKTPRNLNIERNDDRTDNIRLLALAQRWPARTYGSLLERALYQAERLDDLAWRSEGRLVRIRSTPDLATFLARRQTEPELVGALLGVEGAHALDGDVAHLDRLYDAGVRMIGLAHFFDNAFAGSAHGTGKGGLTEAGRALVRRMEEKRILVDLSHASARTIDDVLALARRPVVVSHTGVKGTCDNQRNLSDDQLRRIARNGGLIGIGYWNFAVCGEGAPAIARALRHAARIAGIDHVALGSDYDGAVTVPFDASGLVLVTQALLDVGFSPEDIARIMGGNAAAFLAANLPER
ncbi:MAG TPA: dipeptidase [Polyangia bacterium]|jgi:microsomal dipeptidase-like Zn-dependent dipeptidase|nr:dipeptidase [Polyangia bacterium]